MNTDVEAIALFLLMVAYVERPHKDKPLWIPVPSTEGNRYYVRYSHNTQRAAAFVEPLDDTFIVSFPTESCFDQQYMCIPSRPRKYLMNGNPIGNAPKEFPSFDAASDAAEVVLKQDLLLAQSA